MSARTDTERREAAHAAAIERGKAQLRKLQAVLAHFTEGLSARDSAERLGVSLRQLKRYRDCLLLARWARGVDAARGAEGESSHG